ncbi:MAG: hypothetical protein IJE72_01600 [Clostridia bacterium]|nr:hypothetical protein [Clostridia bacterium]
MKKSLEKMMKENTAVFRGGVKRSRKSNLQTESQLAENFYILERGCTQALKEIRHMKGRFKGSEVFPGLFEKSRELCKKGELPDESGIISFFDKDSGLNGFETELLPLAITCALLALAADGVRAKNSAGSRLLANSIISLRKIRETDFEKITENLCKADEILKHDEFYRSMDEYSKNVYRKRIAVLAKKSQKSETEIAVEAEKKAQKSGIHIGNFLLNFKKKKRNGYLFLAMEIIMPLALSFCISVFLNSPIAGILLFLPLWEMLRYPIESASLRTASVKRFLRLSADCETVRNAHTLITVSTLMPSADKIKELETHLESIWLSNCTGNIKVCCLADLKSAGMPRKPEDKTVIKSAKEAIDRLNRKYGGGFILAVRPRAYSKTQNEFIGRERKRGAITELIRAVKGNEKGFSILHGDVSELNKVKYLIALDADTGLVFDSARDLIAVAEHPLNRPVIKDGRVISGYGIIAPKTEISLKSTNSSVFGRMMAGDSGITAYDSPAGERYQDLFGEGIFCGKGLIDVEAYYRLLDSGLPHETILSHDIVEGGFLRVGYVPEIQITEGMPKTVLSYYQRLHRWIRGDWQNIRLVFGKNPLSFISRYKMFDSLRRSATPVISVSAIIISMFMNDYDAVYITLFSMLSLASRNLYPALCSVFHSGFSSVSRLYFSKALPSALHLFIKAFVALAFSVREAFVCGDAILKSLWRIFVSKKKLLEWTTAAQSEKNSGIKTAVISCIPSMAAGFLFFMLGMPVHRLMGLIILADIPLALFTSTEFKKKKVVITQAQREKIVSYASAMWGFYEDLCGKENNFLPPDNIQFSPVKAVADRTSPTNIGLMLASFLSACDMGFITEAELYMRLNLSLSSIEKLEKYKGNLLNWYSTSTLQPLNPRFVSTVDSGNFLCCLTAVKEGLREYSGECPAFNGIIERIEKIIAETDLLPLFNERRKLFHIGINPDSGEKSNSYYDLYMSEARMTAYFAVARRQVSKNHWGALGRIFVGHRRYTGLASWTGTMFEYFMPNLFVPSPQGSLSREALYFCLYCQRKWAGRLPFGISESGFYAFDRDMNYQYKAHGVQKLALSREKKAETVISPYSTFLTLTEAPSASMKNLKRLEKLGMNGIYGLYEAIDFTKGRGGRGGAVVRSYMAHHVGMSMVAANNLLNSNRMQKRFMSDRFMRGAESLLEEKIQTDSKLFKDIKAEDIPNIRERTHGRNAVYENPSPFSPEAMLLSNGRMTTCISDTGAGITMFDGIDVTVNSGDLFMRPQGVFGVFITEKEIIPFVSALDRASSTKYSAVFSRNMAEHTAKKGEILLKMNTSLLQKHNCELRSFTVENLGHKKTLNGKLIIYFEPCLEKREAFVSHPMFSKLFLYDEIDEENKCILFSRTSSAAKTEYGIAAGIIEDTDFKYETAREKVLRSPLGIFSLGMQTDLKSGRGNPDCCAAFEIEIKLEPGKNQTYTLGIASAESKEQALNVFLTVRAGKAAKKRCENPFFVASAESFVASRLLPSIAFPLFNRGKLNSEEKCIYSKNELWSLGISGENPIAVVEILGGEDIDKVIPYIRINKKLRNCGIKNDLAIVFGGEEKYLRPVTNALKSAAEKEDCGLMIGVSGGVHFIDSTLCGYEKMTALKNSSVFYVRAGQPVGKTLKTKYKPVKMITGKESKKSMSNASSVKQYSFTEEKIKVYKSAETVDIPWNHVLSNRSMGTMVSDKALGFTWAINSRENKLTPWYNDLMSDNRGELLILKYNGVLYDLISLGDAEFTPDSATWKATVSDIEFTIKVSVAKKGMTKKCCIKTVNKSETVRNFDVMYFTVPVLGVNRESGGMFYASKTENGVVLENSFSPMHGFSYLCCNEKADYICLSKKAFFEGSFFPPENNPVYDCCAAVGKNIVLQKGEEKIFDFFLSWGATEKAAKIMPKVADFGKVLLNPIKIESQNKNLKLFFNSFLYSQIKQTRFWGRTGFYQCSGAYGFRDQLQDSLAFIDFEPQLTLAHIARCASVQFEEGDVLHWWHVTVNKTQQINGIRTRCSDDMLWLPYVCIKYRQKTGDESFLNIETPYIEGEELSEHESERYFSPKRTKYKKSIFDHCLRAVDKSLNFGKNGLPLMGSCDWNDGFSRIGESNAESVWLAMFQVIVLEGMAEICNNKGLIEKVSEYAEIADKLRRTLEDKAWCGDRYARIILENGEIFEKKRDFIDILPQAFAVFSELGKNERADVALNTALKKLYDGKTVRLLSPPFEEDDAERVGYIASYPCGIRENGGQYTHAAVWLAIALLQKGRNEEAKSLIDTINPLSFYSDKSDAERYRAEPFVLAGDVSFGNKIDGRAGWTHFTGSASWFYRCIYENVDALNCKILKSNVKHTSFTRRKNPSQQSD